jgi:segregation and condensation protein A
MASSTDQPAAGLGGVGGAGLDVLVGPASATYAVKLSHFEGPLDLLLHLIRINEVEITDIPVAQIAEQYLEYLGLMRELNLDVAGEYLLMAATLAWIKSRMLLPPIAAGDDDEGLDPRAELVARLLEYQRYKDASVELGERRLLGRDVFDAIGPDPEPLPESEREIEVGLFELVEALRSALAEAPPKASPHEVEVETLTVRERMIAVMEILETREGAEFVEVLSATGGQAPSRTMIVTTFLAVLELTRLAALLIYQGLDEFGVPQGPIRLRRASEIDGWAERVAEIM